MKNTIFAFVIALCSVYLFTACNLTKVSHVNITNTNGEPCFVRITANNVTETFGPIAAGASLQQDWKWKNIEPKNGELSFSLLNSQQQEVGHYKYGVFEQGELYNYFTLEVRGVEMLVKIEN